jgi:hypothetical protein
MSAELRSSESKPGTTTAVVDALLRWFRKFWSKYLLQQNLPTSALTAERRAECLVEQAGAITAAVENATARPTTTKSFTDSTTANVKVSSDAKISPIANVVPDQQEIQRRRDVVRTLFTDFWNGSDDKPAGFADRLNQAEDYINERLTACGELWQLDAETRAMLSLPARSNSLNKGKTA